MIALLVASMGFAQTKNISDVTKSTLKFQTSVKHTYKYATKSTRDGDQALVVFSAGDIWGDGTGYQLLIDADNAGWDESYGPDCGSTYTQWEYMLPANASAADANAICNGTQSMYIPAGTYSYLVLNPGCEGYGKNYIASSQCDNSNASDYTFEAGKMYTFTVAISGQNDCVTLTVEDIPAEPTMTTGTTTLSYMEEVGETSNSDPVVINAMNLTAGITATVAAPFEVSADNTTFGTTASLTSDGGTFFVRFVAPANPGNYTGTLTVSSTGVQNLTVALTGIAYNCDDAINPVWTEDFEAASLTKYCWSIYDANQDNNTFNLYTITEEGDHAMGIQYTTDANDDYLITPMLNIGSNANVTFGVAQANETYAETYEVYVLIGQNMTKIRDAATTTTALPEFETITVDLAEYAGQTIQIAIKNISENMLYFFVDNFTLNGVVAINENIANTIAVYPNPTNNMVTVANAEGKNIVVVNSLGQVVANIQNAAANQTIDVANFANGTYFVKVDAEVVKLNVVR